MLGDSLDVIAAPSLLDLLWDDAEQAMIVVDQGFRVRQGNDLGRAAMNRMGIEIGDLVDEVDSRITAPDGSPAFRREDRPLVRALRGEATRRQTYTLRMTADTRPRRMAISAQPVRLSDGSLGALMSWHDVTESWQSAETTRGELERLGQLIEGASDYAIIMLDAYGRVTSWSRAARRLHGYTETEAIGLPYETFFDPAERAAGAPARILTQAVASGKASAEGKRVRPDGSVFWARAVVTAVRGDDGGLKGFVKVTHDVTEQRAIARAVVDLNEDLRRLNEQLEERVLKRTAELERKAADLTAVNAELEALSYSVSHDLRAPLRAISGFARIIQQEFAGDLPAEAGHYLTKVTDNAQQMGSLIDALLSFSRMQRQGLAAEVIDMTALVAECWALLAPARGEREVQFVLEPLPPAEADRRLIQQVWISILDNAIKFSGKQAQARIDVAAEFGYADGARTVTYRVHDNGVGFDMRYAAKIGQVFQRLHHADDYPGIGIGLALTQRILQRHGGTLTASSAPQAGATVGFTLRAVTA